MLLLALWWLEQERGVLVEKGEMRFDAAWGLVGGGMSRVEEALGDKAFRMTPAMRARDSRCRSSLDMLLMRRGRERNWDGCGGEKTRRREELRRPAD